MNNDPEINPEPAIHADSEPKLSPRQEYALSISDALDHFSKVSAHADAQDNREVQNLLDLAAHEHSRHIAIFAVGKDDSGKHFLMIAQASDRGFLTNMMAANNEGAHPVVNIFEYPDGRSAYQALSSKAHTTALSATVLLKK